MGAIVEATQRALDRQVAVKVLRPGASDNAARALIHEARVTGALEHPNIVPVHALGRDERSQPVLVMKRVEGRSWKQVLDEDPQRERMDHHLNVLIQVSNALDFAHARGFVHRDLKPENVMIGEFGEVYLVDWGVALSTVPPPHGPAPIVGTPNWMAPEMLEGDLATIDCRTDVFLLGGLLHYVMVGRPPHRGDSVMQVLIAAWRCEPKSYDPHLPPGLVGIAQRALARSKGARFQSAAELRAAVQGHLQNRAADSIAEEARRHLDRLRTQLAAPTPGESEIYRTFGACRFGFQQAAEISDRRERTGGIEEAITLMARFELARNKPDAAEALAAELDLPHADLSREIAEARARHASEIEELRTLKKESDLERGSRSRAVVLIAMTAAFTVAGMLLQVVTGLLDVNIPFELGLRIAMVVGVVSTLLVARRWFAHNTASRRLALILLTASLALTALRVLGTIGRLEVELVLALDLLLLGACGFVASFALDRRLLPASALAVSAAFVTAALPAFAGELYIGAMLVTVGLVAIAWMRAEG
jgi:serine/threonine-protein kinase